MTKPAIRAAKMGDIPHLVALIEQAREKSIYRDMPMNETALKKTLMGLIGRQGAKSFPCLIVVADGESGIEGAIVAISRPVYEVLEGTGVTDLFWFVRPGGHRTSGIRLLRAMHRWAAKLPKPVIIEQRTSDAVVDGKGTARVLSWAGMKEVGRVYRTEITE